MQEQLKKPIDQASLSIESIMEKMDVKIEVKNGDQVCLTKSGKKIAGQLEGDIVLNQPIRLKGIGGLSGYDTTPVTGVTYSFNAILVETDNSTYLLEKF